MRRYKLVAVFLLMTISTIAFMQNCGQNSFEFASTAPDQQFEQNKLVQCEDRNVSEAGRNTIPLVKVVVVLDNTPSMTLIKTKISQGLKTLAQSLREYDVQFFALSMNHTDLRTAWAPAVTELATRCDSYRFEPPTSSNRVLESSVAGNCPTTIPNGVSGRTSDAGNRRIYEQVVERRLRNSLLSPMANFRFGAQQFSAGDPAFVTFQNQLAAAIVAIPEGDQPNELGMCTIAHALQPQSPIYAELTQSVPGDNRLPVVAFLTLSDEDDKSSVISFNPPRPHPDCFKSRITIRDCSQGSPGTIAGTLCNDPSCSYFNPVYSGITAPATPAAYPRYEYQVETQAHVTFTLQTDIQRNNTSCDLQIDTQAGTVGSHKVVVTRRQKAQHTYTVRYSEWGLINTEVLNWKPYETRTFTEEVDTCNTADSATTCVPFVEARLGITAGNRNVPGPGGKRLEPGSCQKTCSRNTGADTTVDVPNMTLPTVTTDIPPYQDDPALPTCVSRFSSSDQAGYIYSNCRILRTNGAAPSTRRYSPGAGFACSNFPVGSSFNRSQFLSVWTSMDNAAAGRNPREFITSNAIATVVSASIPSSDISVAEASMITNAYTSCASLNDTTACNVAGAQAALDTATSNRGNGYYRNPAGNCRLKVNSCTAYPYSLTPLPKTIWNRSGACSPDRACNATDIGAVRSNAGLGNASGPTNPYRDIHAPSCEYKCYQPPTPTGSPVSTSSRLRVYTTNSANLPATCEEAPQPNVFIRDSQNLTATFTSIRDFMQRVGNGDYANGTCAKIANGTQAWNPADPVTLYQCATTTTTQVDMFGARMTRQVNSELWMLSLEWHRDTMEFQVCWPIAISSEPLSRTLPKETFRPTQDRVAAIRTRALHLWKTARNLDCWQI